MKILSIVVPCYNSESYIQRCLDSLLEAECDDLEIIIVNDGSSDRTPEIADAYARKYSETVKSVHRPNGGHGAAINTGLESVSGAFFKIVDSDDWVSPNALKLTIEALRPYADGSLDLFISNFVYEKENKKHKKVMSFEGFLPQDRIFRWSEAGRFRVGRYMLMHALTYRTSLLKEIHFHLPEHTFYVDNLYAYTPLPKVKTLFYLNTDLYHYYIGRADQSVNEKVMLKRIDQQLKVNKLMAQEVCISNINDPKIRAYMLKYLEIVTTVSSIMALRANNAENLEKKKQLWMFLKDTDKAAYKKLRMGLLGIGLHLRGSIGRGIALSVYYTTQKIVGFN
ncbi:MAG: glycosyltransferase [Clostridiales bacterium]|jgi:glycosyltransferase involved in cell wall biosynthesis|nr:glycosyltransferase [Clostridiales bacterium]